MHELEHLPTFQSRGKAIGFFVAGVVLCAVGFLTNSAGFLPAYLFSYLFWIGAAVGSLGLMLLINLTGGGWGAVIYRLLTAGAKTLPLMAVLFLPILFGMRDLYEWASPEALAHDELLQAKAGYLNPTFFVLRTVVYFAFWLGATVVVLKAVGRWDAGERGLRPAVRGFSGFAMWMLAYSVTFASVDWSMSLEPHWYSTIFGMKAFVSMGLITFAAMIVGLRFLLRFPGVDRFATEERIHDLGKLLFGFTNLWAYMSFAQLIIIWSGNLPELNIWYIKRSLNGWNAVGVILIVFHFGLPFLILLSRYSKQRIEILSLLALWLLVMQLVDQFYQVIPVFRPGLSVTLTDVLVPLGMGALWIGGVLWSLHGRRVLVPHDDLVPRGAH
ncbi:MAG: hypothetical protein KatS3mg115_2376 [Candidatus Poribacteria bacterium]|nr:MAG: hypothetical protein KatS3mg115_2376 [Candidatus Poribacteria bacterium]